MTQTSQQGSALVAQIRACHLCNDLAMGPRPIVQLDPKAKILIASQAPGRIAHEKGIPFEDPSGERLRAWLNVSRETFYDIEKIAILPMGFCFPGKGGGGDLPPRSICAQTWRKQVMQMLAGVELTIIIGRYAIDWHAPHLSKARVTQAVGEGQALLPEKIILPHPSPRNNRWIQNNPWFEDQVIPKLQTRVAQVLDLRNSSSLLRPLSPNPDPI